MPRILVVEDEASVSSNIAERLAALGYQLAGRAACTEQVLEQVETQHPDLVLMDVHLAGNGNGIKIAQEIHQKFHLPIIFLSTFSENETFKRAKVSEHFGYLLKPFEDQELKFAIEIAHYKHQANAEIHRLTRIFKVLSYVNQTVTHSHSREELLDAVCRILVERGKVDLAWVGWLDPATSHIKPVAQHGRSNDILGQMDYYADNRPEGQGNPGKAIREGKAFICKVCPGEACLYPSEKQPYRFGFQSCGSFPLRFQGQVGAVLNICVSEPKFFGDRETELLHEVTLNLSFALDKLAAEARQEQAEKAVHDSETRFRRLFESMRDAYAEVDLDGNIISVNKMFKELIGYDDAELAQLNYKDITPEQWHEPEKKILQEQILTQGYSEVYEKEYRRKDGTVIPVELRTFLLRDGSGQPTGMWAIVRDITQRKQTEEDLRQSEEKFHLAMDAAQEGLWDWDLATGELYWSPGFFHVVGYDPTEIKPNYQLWEDHIHPEDLPRVLNTVRKYLAGQTPSYECEYRVRTKAGRYIWILARGRVVRYDLDGTPRRMMGAVSDITGKKQVQDTLEQSLSLLQATLEATDEGILAVNLDGRIMDWNRNFLEMWHIPEKIIGNRDNNLLKLYVMDQLQDSQSFLRLVDKLYTQSESETCDLLHFKDGRVFEQHTKPQYHDGQIIGRVLSFRDITDKLRSETTLKESEARYRRIVETMGEGIWVVDQNYQTTYVNQVMAEMLGYRPEEMLGQSVLVFLFPEDIKQHEKMRVRRRQGLRDKYERRFQRQDGSELWTRISATAIMDETGSFQGSFGMFIDITKKKRAEGAMRQSEERYRSLVGNLPVGVYRRTVGEDNRLLMANPALLQIFGYDAADNFMEFGSFPTYADPNQHKQFNEQLALNGQVSGAELDLLKKDGTPFQARVWAQRRGKGAEACIEGVLIDISQSRRMEEALRHNEQFMTDVFNSIQDGLCILDRELNIIRFNDRMASIPTLNPMIGKKCYESFHNRTEPCDICAAQTTLRTGKPAERIIGISTAAGSTNYAELKTFPMVNRETGQIDGVIEVSRDVTERQGLEEKIKADDQFLNDIFSSIKDGLSILDLDLNVIRTNPAMKNFVHFPPVLGRKCYEAYHNRKTPCEICPVLHTLKTGEANLAVIDANNGAGETAHYEIYSYPFIDRQGRLAGAIEYVRDVTEQKKVEQSLQVMERQFLQAQKLESLGRLAGGIAHDFNNMLAVILGNTEVALMDVGPQQSIRKNLEEVKSAAQRSAELVRHLLAFARQQVVTPKILNLNDTVSDLLKILRRLIGEDIELICKYGPDLWNVLIDPSQIDQILANLLVNARDAIAGVGKVAIETANVSLDEVYCAENTECIPGDYTLLAVSDSGCGMGREMLEHIFEPFFTTKEQWKGTGLGLATVYGIVKQNLGFINVYSEPDRGTTFKIYLPRNRTEALPALEGDSPVALLGSSEIVLLVEDEEVMLNLCQASLERLGYSVPVARTPKGAIRLAEGHAGKIDLMLTDVVMPEMNGLELADRLKSMQPTLKCLYMSGYSADVITYQALLEEGMNFLQKPFTFIDLSKKVRQALVQ